MGTLLGAHFCLCRKDTPSLSAHDLAKVCHNYHDSNQASLILLTKPNTTYHKVKSCQRERIDENSIDPDHNGSCRIWTSCM